MFFKNKGAFYLFERLIWTVFH